MPKPKRYKEAGNYVARGGIFPTSIFVNYRGKLEFVGDETSDLTGTLRVSNDTKFYLVDGQHRMLALKFAIEDLERTDLENLQLPIVISNFESEMEEMTQFRTINRTQKSVPTDLTDRLINKELQASTDLEELMRAGRMKDYRTLKSVEIIKTLNMKANSPWKGLIREPNVAVAEAPDTFISERSMTQSLADFLRTTDALSVEKSVEILINYWNAIHELYPEASERPEDYPYLWNTTGIYTLHMVLPTVMEQVGSNTSKEKLKEILANLECMKSSYWEKDGILKGIGGIGGFKKIASDIKADIIFD